MRVHSIFPIAHVFRSYTNNITGVQSYKRTSLSPSGYLTCVFGCILIVNVSGKEAFVLLCIGSLSSSFFFPPTVSCIINVFSHHVLPLGIACRCQHITLLRVVGSLEMHPCVHYATPISTIFLALIYFFSLLHCWYVSTKRFHFEHQTR